MKPFFMLVAVETHKTIRIIEQVPFALREFKADHAIEIAAARSLFIEHTSKCLIVQKLRIGL